MTFLTFFPSYAIVSYVPQNIYPFQEINCDLSELKLLTRDISFISRFKSTFAGMTQIDKRKFTMKLMYWGQKVLICNMI